MTKRQIKKTCLLFGEGTREEIFFRFLEGSIKFETQYYKNWRLSRDHAFGCSCKDILNKCINVIIDKKFTLILCFIDSDKLIGDFPSSYIGEKKKLEKLAQKHNINIIWQHINHEDELSRATNGKIKDKKKMKEKLNKYEDLITKSSFCKKIFNLFDEI